MGIGTKKYVIRKRDLVEKKNGLFWKDGIQGVHPHPVNERLLRSIKKSFPAKAFEVLGTWEEWEEYRDMDPDVKTPRVETSNSNSINDPGKHGETSNETETAKKEADKEEEKEEVNKYDSMNMAQLREVAKGLIDKDILNTYKGQNGKFNLAKRLNSL